MKVRLRGDAEREIAVADAVDIVRSADYVRWYDSLPTGDPDRLAVHELAYPAFLDAVPDFRALLAKSGWSSLDSSLRRASDCLRRLPQSVPLARWADTDEHRRLVKDLFVATTGGKNGSLALFGPARCTKMLHRKRPALIPIIDSWQMEAFDRNTDSWSTDDMVDVVFKIRKVMADQQDEFRDLAESLQEADPSLPQLTAIRLYDILFWELSQL